MSEKQDKRRCNRILRRRSKIRLTLDGEAFMEIFPEQALNVWDMDKDGKQYWLDHDAAWMRK